MSANQGGGIPCFDGDGNLFTTGWNGLFRWPVRPDPKRAGRLMLGPPEKLPFAPSYQSLATSRNGRVVAQACRPTGGWLLHPDAGKLRHVESLRCDWVSVSPDGHWVACTSRDTGRIHVYEAATGKRAWQSAAGFSLAPSRFSRDGRWFLGGSYDGGRAFAVGTWESGPHLGLGTPWDLSPDNRLAVVGQGDGIYRLVERATGKELVRLEDPDQVAGSAVFTPDGTRLVIAGDDGLRVWDLRRIRAELVELDLDWAAPPFPQAPAAPRESLQVQVDLGSLSAQPKDAIALLEKGLAHSDKGELDEACRCYREAITPQPYLRRRPLRPGQCLDEARETDRRRRLLPRSNPPQ